MNVLKDKVTEKLSNLFADSPRKASSPRPSPSNTPEVNSSFFFGIFLFDLRRFSSSISPFLYDYDQKRALRCCFPFKTLDLINCSQCSSADKLLTVILKFDFSARPYNAGC